MTNEICLRVFMSSEENSELDCKYSSLTLIHWYCVFCEIVTSKLQLLKLSSMIIVSVALPFQKIQIYMQLWSTQGSTKESTVFVRKYLNITIFQYMYSVHSSFYLHLSDFQRNILKWLCRVIELPQSALGNTNIGLQDTWRRRGCWYMLVIDYNFKKQNDNL